MKSRKVLRYYCDHCGRGNWKKAGCAEHESRCFNNPARCPVDGELYPYPDIRKRNGDEVDHIWPQYYWDPDPYAGGVGDMNSLVGWEPYEECPDNRDEKRRYFAYRGEGEWHPISAEAWREYLRKGYTYEPPFELRGDDADIPF